MPKLRSARCTPVAFFCSFLLSCGSSDKDVQKQLPGNWLILYPDHQLTSQHQRDVYGRYQDSVVGLYGLKLVTFGADGAFREADSLLKPSGKWVYVPEDGSLKIREAGKGFNPFNTTYGGIRNGELLLTQRLSLEDEKINVVWHLKKIESGSEADRLFSPDANAWRKKPAAPQDRRALEKRLAAILNYYGDYFLLLSRESSYFSYLRVPLPFRYYQHAVALQREMKPAFLNLFYNNDDALAAYGLLERGLGALHANYLRGENLAAEYGLFFKKLADWIGE